MFNIFKFTKEPSVKDCITEFCKNKLNGSYNAFRICHEKYLVDVENYSPRNAKCSIRYDFENQKFLKFLQAIPDKQISDIVAYVEKQELEAIKRKKALHKEAIENLEYNKIMRGEI